MTTFAKASFNAASYASFRPSYPPALYQHLLAYHKGPRNVCLELGCGHGVVSRNLAPHFKRVIATDPSPNMVKQAQAQTPASDFPNVQVNQGTAENLSAVESGSVDMVCAAQAAHWFDFKRAWPEMFRVLRPGGTLALWCYKDHVYVDYPKASGILLGFMYGDSKETLGPFWEPGRQIVRGNYRAIQPPKDLFVEEKRIEYEPETKGPGSGKGENLMRRTMTVDQSKEYMHTWSSVHSWQEAHGNPKAKDDGGDGDITDKIHDAMKEAEGWDDKTQLVMEWWSSIILARKKES
jgi:trans-aconitate 3-methyltransferase